MMYLFVLRKLWNSLNWALTTRSDGKKGIDMAAMIGGILCSMTFAIETGDRSPGT